MALDQRGGFDREVAHEGRLVQLVLVEVLPQVFDELAVVLHVVAFHAELVGDLAQVLHGGAGVVRTAVRHDFLAQGLGKGVVHADGLPFAAEVVFGAVQQRHLVAAEHVHGGVLHELLDERADGVVVAVGLVCLDHGEFRGVGGVDALVAEVAVDFEHAVDAADEATLQEQFRRDAQVEVQVEGVHMRGERTGRGAAVHGLQHRSFDLEEVMVGEGFAQRGDGLGTVAHHVADLLVRDHADVRLAGTSVFVQLLVQRRQRLQRLGRDGPFGGEHGQFAGLGGDHAALDEQVVAQIDQLLELLQGVGANLLLGDHALDLGAVAGGQLHEAQAARVAQEQHTAGDADHVLGLGARFELAVILGADLFDGGGDVKGHRVRLDAFLKHHGALGHTHLHLLRVGQRAEFLIGRVHGLVQRGAAVDLGANRSILLQQHFGAFHRGHGGNCGLFFVLILLGFVGLSHKPQVYREATTQHATRRPCIQRPIV